MRYFCTDMLVGSFMVDGFSRSLNFFGMWCATVNFLIFKYSSLFLSSMNSLRVSSCLFLSIQPVPGDVCTFSTLVRDVFLQIFVHTANTRDIS